MGLSEQKQAKAAEHAGHRIVLSVPQWVDYEAVIVWDGDEIGSLTRGDMIEVFDDVASHDPVLVCEDCGTEL